VLGFDDFHTDEGGEAEERSMASMCQNRGRNGEVGSQARHAKERRGVDQCVKLRRRRGRVSANGKRTVAAEVASGQRSRGLVCTRVDDAARMGWLALGSAHSEQYSF
jgi:hypothetical protein